MNTTIRTQSGHTMCLVKIESLPMVDNHEDYSKIYEVRNFDKKGVVFMYVCTGYKAAKKEVHVFYPNGCMWSGFGKSIAEAINGAQKDGWLYTTRK